MVACATEPRRAIVFLCMKPTRRPGPNRQPVTSPSRGTPDDRPQQAPQPQPGRRQQGQRGAPETSRRGAKALHGPCPAGLWELPFRAVFCAHVAMGRDERVVALQRRLRPALGALLGHAARARQPVSRARAPRPATRAAFRVRDASRRPPVRATGQLCAAQDRPARRRHGGPEAPPLHRHRPARRPRPGNRRVQGRLAGRGRAARRPSCLLRHVLPDPRAGTDAARCLRRRGQVRSPRP